MACLRHARFADRSPTRHSSEDGESVRDEEESDGLNILGVYATSLETEARRNEPEPN
ncbi:hypothetical protein [Arthrobacter crystallopoietes]|uniref:hypothetical protein n=1 Tax=Crystallibacter crystallopoietes TaxID=37928 RepID=UPI001ABDE7E1|nr:hypothetical protein [Arthrobacter crystallopoietes]QTG81726.1 hypothetical protein J5251_03760 [Arthrobacter crystallopoietes]